ncbi:hypothetical protein GLU64_00670 [Nanohaloarchaea archaeon]|nr:hypothetical protein [Candidatus Nanohaloarchaea archaeon]
MKDVRQAVKKGALASTTVFIVVSTIFSFLSIGVGSDLVLGSFIDLATTSDRKWVQSNIANNAHSMCNEDQDGVLPEDRNFTRKFNQVEKIKGKVQTEGFANQKVVEYLSFRDEDGNQRFSAELDSGVLGNLCDIGLNTSSLTSSGSGIDDIDSEKNVKFRLFSGSSVQGSEDVIIQIRQEG